MLVPRWLAASAVCAVLLVDGPAVERVSAGLSCASCPANGILVVSVSEYPFLPPAWRTVSPPNATEIGTAIKTRIGSAAALYTSVLRSGDDPGALPMRPIIEQAFKRFQSLRRRDRVVIVLSGLVTKDGAEAAFLPSDARVHPGGATENAITGTELRGWLESIRAEVLLVVDALQPSAADFPVPSTELLPALPRNVVALLTRPAQPTAGAPGLLVQSLFDAWKTPGASTERKPQTYAELLDGVTRQYATAGMTQSAPAVLGTDLTRDVLSRTARAYELTKRVLDVYQVASWSKGTGVLDRGDVDFVDDLEEEVLERMLQPRYVDSAKRLMETYPPKSDVFKALPRLSDSDLDAFLQPLFGNLAVDAPHCDPSGVTRPAPRALLIGIQEFPADRRLSPLAGPANDVGLLRHALVARGVPVDRITALSGRATRLEVIHALDTLIRHAECGATVFVHLSGNAFPALRFQGVEYREFAGTRPEWAFATSDSRADSKAEAAQDGWLRATELATALTALRNRGAFVFLSIDGCEAGAVDLSGRVRNVWRWQPFSASRAELPSAAGGAGFSAFYAAADGATTIELSLPKDEPNATVYGLFTFALANAIGDTQNVSTRDLAEAVTQYYRQQNAEVAAVPKAQPQPLFEGTDPDQPLFGVVAVKQGIQIELTEPVATRGVAVVKAQKARVSGRVVPATNVTAVAINGKVENVSREGAFSTELDLLPGRNRVQIMGVTRDSRPAFFSFEVDSRPDDDATVRPHRSVALIIANQDYGEPSGFGPLKTPVRDAEDVAQVLKERYGFETQLTLRNGSVYPLLLKNPSRSQILDALDTLRQSLLQDDALLIYYAGHGWKDSAEAVYWIPVDARNDALSTYVAADDITRQIKLMNTRHVLVVSDSCYAGGLMRGEQQPSAGGIDTMASPEAYKQYINEVVRKRSRILIASGADEPVADSGGDGHSIFARALLNGLRQEPLEAFTAEDLFNRYIKKLVVVGADQTPQYRTIPNLHHENGDFVFFRTTLPK